MVVTLGIREFASNDRHVFLEVVVRSWTNSHRNEVELVLHGRMVYMVTAVLVHLAYLISYYLRWQLYSAVPQFPVLWPSEMTSATFCESQSHSPVLSPVPSAVHRIQTALYLWSNSDQWRYHAIDLFVAFLNHSEVTWHSTASCVSGRWWHSKPVERSDFNIAINISQVNILFWGHLKYKHMPRSFLSPCAKDLFPRLGVVVER